MRYAPGSLERRLIEDDARALADVVRWIAEVLAAARFWRLRGEWPDLHQEVLLRVVESLRRGRFDPSRDFKTYVQAVARYTALGAIAATARRREAPADPSAPAMDPVAEDTLLARQLVRRVLDQATPECRSLIEDYYLRGSTYAEIAAARKMREGTVKSRLFRCLRRAHRLLRVLRGNRSGPGPQ